jgi:hypothetical protein
MWGPWATGMALTDASILQRFEKAGLTSITATAGMALLDGFLAAGDIRPAASIVAAGISWHRLLRGHSKVPGIFSEFTGPAGAEQQAVEAATVHAAGRSRRLILAEGDVEVVVTPKRKARAPQRKASVDDGTIADELRNMVGGMLGADVAPDQPLMEAGLDSLGE